MTAPATGKPVKAGAGCYACALLQNALLYGKHSRDCASLNAKGAGHTDTNIIVAVGGRVVVAVGGAQVRRVVVGPGTTAQSMLLSGQWHLHRLPVSPVRVKPAGFEEGMAQLHGIGMARMGDPTANTRLHLGTGGSAAI
jgi:hypothetical protein